MQWLNHLPEKLPDLEELLAEGFMDKTRLRELHRSQAKIQGELADLRVSLDESELKILQLRKRFKTQVVELAVSFLKSISTLSNNSLLSTIKLSELLSKQLR